MRYFKCIFLFSLVTLLTRCKNEIKDESYRGQKKVAFSSDKSGYAWDFTRLYNDTLIEQKRYDIDNSKLYLAKFLSDNILSALDYRNGRIYFFSDSLKVNRIYNDSRVKEIMNYDFDGNKLRVYDFTNRSPKTYLTPSDSLGNFNFIDSVIIADNPGVYRLGFLQYGNFIYAHPNTKTKELEFIVYNSSDSSSPTTKSYNLSHILNSTKTISYPELAYDGDFVSDQSSSMMVYYCRFGGAFFVFDKKTGDFKYTAHTVDGTPFPIATNVKIAPGISHLENKPDITFFLSASTYTNKIFLLNYISESKTANVDIYELDQKEAKYINSIHIPTIDEKRPTSITVDKNELVALYEPNTLIKYSIKSFNEN